MVKTHSGGNMAIFYNIELINSGNRPALDVRLEVDHNDVFSAMLPEAKSAEHFESDIASIHRCFEERSTIPVLLNGSTASNSFGQTSLARPLWRPGAVFPVTVSYKGYGRQKYRSIQRLRIDDTAGFAGSYYEPPSNT